MRAALPVDEKHVSVTSMHGTDAKDAMTSHTSDTFNCSSPEFGTICMHHQPGNVEIHARARTIRAGAPGTKPCREAVGKNNNVEDWP